MRKTQMRFALVFMFLVAPLAVGAQGQGDRVPSSWTTATVSGAGQPKGYVDPKVLLGVSWRRPGNTGHVGVQAKTRVPGRHSWRSGRT